MFISAIPTSIFKTINGPFRKLTGLLVKNKKNKIPISAIPIAKETTGSMNGKGAVTVSEVMDELVTSFCKIHGGLEEAMPIIRKQFEKANVQFSNPSKQDLLKALEQLTKTTAFLKGHDLAQDEHRRIQRLIRKIA